MDSFLLQTTLALLSSLAVFLLFRYWSFGLALVMLLFAAHVFADYFPPLVGKPYNIYPDDIVFVLLSIGAVLRLLIRRRFSLQELSWLCLCLLVLIAFIRGILVYGMASAGNDARAFLGLIVCVIYFETHGFTTKKLKIFVSAWKCVAAFLVVVAAVRWAALTFGVSLGGPGENMDGWLRYRVLNAAQALFIFQAILIWRISSQQADFRQSSLWLRRLVIGRRRGARFWTVAIWVSWFVAIIVLQHRSVWAVCIFSFLLILLHEGQRTRVIFVAVLLLCMAAAMWTFADFSGSILGESLRESSREAMNTEDSTFIWRVEQWVSYVNPGYLLGAVEWILGKPFGAPYGSVFGGEETSPHNWFVFLVVRLGFLGLFMACVTMTITFSRLWRLSRSSLPLADSAKPLLFLLGTFFIFAIPYVPSFEQCIYIGLAVALSTQFEGEFRRLSSDRDSVACLGRANTPSVA